MTVRPLVALVVTALLLGGCSGTEEPADPPDSANTEAAPSASRTPDPADDPAYDPGLSDPVEDRVYPRVGDPGIDALHYDLELTWDPDARDLDATEALTFRATQDADLVRLDLSPELTVGQPRIDGEPVEFDRRGKDLVLRTDVVADERYTLTLDYVGTPAPVRAPTTRADVPALGWTTTGDGSVWTMQEPFGAYTWYAVNDQPSDKALYDVTLSVPDPMVGVSNGELVSRNSEGGTTTTEWRLAEPAASYLMTVAFGDYATDEVTSASGIPISLWLPKPIAGQRMDQLRRDAVDAVDWTEDLLGDYPFDTLGFLYVDSTSGMETQTMITLGTTDYTFSMPVLVHEVVHQWWGDQVTPRDWRDVWMNEGMTMYLQAMWESENGGLALDERMDQWAAGGQALRDETGPPAAYDAAKFAEPNVYYLPAVMWHDVRGEIGDRTFFRLMKEWPASRDNGNADYDEIVAWWSDESGTDLAPLFRAHLLGRTQPAA
ncbi:M1 family metallopeptidase [Nocardioides aestuarii]|uniref:Aminopeptidase N n=1 Tax=Nocardioides aestuarii TaxID=252231 RepID=A0ABW4TMU2_9ACTN